LFVLLASQAPVGVIFRRGPSERVQVIHWSLDGDRFEAGQWFYGRIYERRCDLSPDGRYLAYFALKRTARQARSDYDTTWTAVSRPPYLTALALWPQGNTYNGGAVFADNATLLLNNPPGFWYSPHPRHVPPDSFKVEPLRATLGGDDSVLHVRLKRDGWRHVQRMERWPHSHEEGTTYHPAEVWERSDREGRFCLTWTTYGTDRGGGKYKQVFAVVNAHSGETIPLPADTTWADWDRTGRLLWAHGGRLYATRLDQQTVSAAAPAPLGVELADFNDARPRLLAPPEWALSWDTEELE
jgi:hypothetical protein